MLRLLTDENFDNKIVGALARRVSKLDLLSVRDVGLAAMPDAQVLKWAAQHARTTLTHDINTMIPCAKCLIEQDELMTGVILIPDRLAIGRAVDDLELIIECYSEFDMLNNIEYLLCN
jgi:uncharacterized protein DUF5615